MGNEAKVHQPEVGWSHDGWVYSRISLSKSFCPKVSRDREKSNMKILVRIWL